MTGNNDLISREDAIQALLTIPTHSGSLKAMMISRIEDLPSVTQSDKECKSLSALGEKKLISFCKG